MLNLEPRKLDLISWIAGINNANLIEKLESLRNSEDNWWNSLPGEIQEEINKSDNQSDENNVISHQEAMKSFK